MTGLRSIAVMAVVLAALAAVYVLTSRPDVPEEAPRPELWSVPMDDLAAVTIDLPAAGRRGAWVKETDGEWYGADADHRSVDAQRWRGISLLLSGPKAERLIATAATPEQLASYGLVPPRMKVDLALGDGRTVRAEVGDPTPGGSAYYLRLATSTDVYSVHETWFAVLERLVLEPPYAGEGG